MVLPGLWRGNLLRRGAAVVFFEWVGEFLRSSLEVERRTPPGGSDGRTGRPSPSHSGDFTGANKFAESSKSLCLRENSSPTFLTCEKEDPRKRHDPALSASFLWAHLVPCLHCNIR
ncbi:hypothetical protein AMECASPLE_000531 [Ameca splendens]|uniref:Secreted protein n=1 Tax=Ameca splendens TaxID=208324 RepID=A0ABV0ZK09_9TELE